MPKVICLLPNASTNINGHDFEAHASGGVISKEHLDAETIAYFTSVPGFAVDGETAGRIDFDGQNILITGEPAGDRTIPLSDEQAAFMRAGIDAQRAGVPLDESYLAAVVAADRPAGDHAAAAGHDAAGEPGAGVPAADGADPHAAAVAPAAAPVAAKPAIPKKKATAAKK